MTDLRERVARALVRCISGHDMYYDKWFKEADAAIAECFAWQPMETAPKDTAVLLRAGPKTCGRLTFIGWRDGDGWRDEYAPIFPIGWQPLPPAPEGATP